jgi:DNA-binding beta-propeller fold protein YncE
VTDILLACADIPSGCLGQLSKTGRRSEAYADKLSKITPDGSRTVICNFTAGSEPLDVAIDSSGNYIVIEMETGALSKITPAGVRSVIYNFTNEPAGVSIDSQGNYIVSETHAHKISLVTPGGARMILYNYTGSDAREQPRETLALTSTRPATSIGGLPDYTLYTVACVVAVAIIAVAAFALRRRH